MGYLISRSLGFDFTLERGHNVLREPFELLQNYVLPAFKGKVEAAPDSASSGWGVTTSTGVVAIGRPR